MKEEISVYIPAYNAEKTIIYSIEALLKQSLPPSEILIINDCSTDSTQEILNNYKNKVITYNNDTNKGLGYCRNLGIKLATNEFVASIDADVVPVEDWLEKIYSSTCKEKVVYCGAKLIEKNISDNIYNKWRSIHLIQNWGDKSFRNPPFIFGCNSILKKKIWLEVGGYDETLKTNGEDINFCKKLSENKLVTFYDSATFCYHLREDDLSSLSKRYWRYKTFGYKIKKFTLLKFIKISIKEIKMLFRRIFSNIKKKDYNF